MQLLYLWKMIQIGKFNKLKVLREKPAGLYLEGTEEGILLPKRFVLEGTKVGDTVNVFLYHDSEERLIATTQKPYGEVDEVVMLKVVSVTSFGAFLDMGLMKDLFIPKSNMRHFMRIGGYYLVRIIIDEKTGRLSATEYIESYLSNASLTVKELDEVQLTVYRKTQIGYETIINNIHKGILHFNEIYRPVKIGDRFRGYVKKIFEKEESGETLIDVAAGEHGYSRVEGESEKILRLLKEHDGYLPYYDKSDPKEIYDFFQMSKKTFKMSVGKLLKEGKIKLTKTGIVVANHPDAHVL